MQQVSDEPNQTGEKPLLQQILLAPDRQPAVVDDCITLIQEQVGDMSGVSGAAIKVAYKSVNAIAANTIRNKVTELLPTMAAALDPFWESFRSSGGADFGDYLSKDGTAVADALLAVTDADAAKPDSRPVVVKAYKTVRGQAAKHIVNALPRLGALVQKHAG
jgi:hypothetical protein